ncbi:hypothetical protein ARMGADRAFT_482365 [Armillaria gallica]|uniref:Uncharacterized protein n=1 Tax=Armillaria gallica TaxID=47427 RepID=A0A2H3EHY2_ARMGA|nr:hypothetical protein ARMGADRAFT_482365 [Armillaria gallica]
MAGFDAGACFALAFCSRYSCTAFAFWVLKFVVRAYAMYPIQNSDESSKVCKRLVWDENSVGIISLKDGIAIYMATGDPHPLSACDVSIQLERPLLAIHLHASRRRLYILCYGRLLHSGKRQESFGNCWPRLHTTESSPPVLIDLAQQTLTRSSLRSTVPTS